jgi:hypothetical protein
VHSRLHFKGRRKLEALHDEQRLQHYCRQIRGCEESKTL